MTSGDLDDRLAGPYLRTAIGVWLVCFGGFATYALLSLFPETELVQVVNGQSKAGQQVLHFGNLDLWWFLVKGTDIKPERGLALLALFAGICGSFLHAAQSFAAFRGNRELKASWAWWYCLRLPIGAVLGLLFYFVVRAGLLSASTDSVSPYGVVAFGALAGWFSKQASDKLAEVFDVLFVTKRSLKDPLSTPPKISSVAPSPVPPKATPPIDVALTIVGSGFMPQSASTLGGLTLHTTYVSPTQLTAVIPAAQSPLSGSRVNLTITNPPPGGASSPFPVVFQ